MDVAGVRGKQKLTTRIAEAYASFDTREDPALYLRRLTEVLDELCDREGVRPPYFPTRCADPDCDTLLSRYNRGDRCSKHEEPVFAIDEHLPLRSGNKNPRKQTKCPECKTRWTKEGAICKVCRARPYEPEDQTLPVGVAS